ncbi:MAG: hypothetical protein ABR540_08620 [Acidimicrobiales bacterium]
MADAGGGGQPSLGEIRLLNFHDTVMNANLLMGCMAAEPIADDEALVERRWRFERLWLAMLYVALESWRSTQMAPVRELTDRVVGNAQLEDLISEGEASGRVANLRQVRDYMCHRDRRDYWEGRLAAIAGGAFDFHLALQRAFNRLTLLTLRNLNQAEAGDRDPDTPSAPGSDCAGDECP